MVSDFWIWVILQCTLTKSVVKNKLCFNIICPEHHPWWVFFFFQFSTWIKAHMMMGRVSARQSWNKPRVHTGWVMPKGSQVFSDFISHLTEKCWVLTSWQNQKLWFTLYNFHGQSHVLLTFAPLSQYFLIVLNWHRVDLQWLRCRAKWFSYTYIYIHTFYI